MGRRPVPQPSDQLSHARTRDELASELSRLRQRGIDYLEVDNLRQHRVDTPRLSALAEQAELPPAIDRVGQLRAYLDLMLDGYAYVRPEESNAIRGLFFDRLGRSPGPGRPTGLLREARRAAGLSEEAFRKLQREYFVDFARYLLTTAEATGPRRRPGLTLLTPLQRPTRSTRRFS